MIHMKEASRMAKKKPMQCFTLNLRINSSLLARKLPRNDQKTYLSSA